MRSSAVCSPAAAQMRALRATVSGARALAPRPQRGYRAGGPVRAAWESVVTTPAEKKLAENNGGADASPANGSAAAASPTAEAPRTRPSPGEDDRQRFALDESVDRWKPFSGPKLVESINGDPSAPLPDRLQRIVSALTDAVSGAGVLGSTEAARYWAYHLARAGFFTVQGVAGLFAARSAIGRGASADGGPLTRLESIVRAGLQGPLMEALFMWQQDLANIEAGRYVMPWDMAPTHRQLNPLYVLRKATSFVSEATATLRRRDAGVAEPNWLKTALLPDYFMEGFHYQTDGWMSARSAQNYETSTETLFVGRQDAMQRSTLLPLADYMAGKDAASMQALEVGAGTGRFATFVKDNYPSLQLTLADLSPFYLAEARSNMRYWKRQRAPDAQLGGTDGTGVAYLQTAAEKLDLPNASQDVVYSVYLFHELPPVVQEAAAREMARVLKPGGLLVLTDSVQRGDRDSYDATLGNFGDFQEPFYRAFVERPLGPLFEAAGLRCGTKVVGSSTKTLSFTKPGPGDLFALNGSAATTAAAAAAEVKAESLMDE